MKHLALVTVLTTWLAFVLIGRELPEFGDNKSPAALHVSPRYIENSLTETGSDNMVTAVIADYRSFDTLGEVVVIFAAGVACLLILGLRKDELS